MKTLDRYISKKFLISIAAMFFLCFVLIFLIDLIEMLREAVKRGGTMGDAMLISLMRVPAFAEMSLPFAVLIGSIGAFLNLSKNSELIVARASGMSVWQFAMPAVIVGGLIGAFITFVYNPGATWAREHSEDLQADLVNKKKKLITTGKATWLRQDGVDGQSILTARLVTKRGRLLTDTTFFQYDDENHFKERIDARSAQLQDGRWELLDAHVSVPNEKTKVYKRYYVSTFLSPTQVQDTIGDATMVPFWALPDYIDIAEKAGMPALQFHIQYQMLLSRPLWMIAMVLLAATCSLQSFRFGNVQKMILYGLLSGFGFFVFDQISRNMGLSGNTPVLLSVWGPAIVACLAASTVLIHQEDG